MTLTVADTGRPFRVVAVAFWTTSAKSWRHQRHNVGKQSHLAICCGFKLPSSLLMGKEKHTAIAPSRANKSSTKFHLNQARNANTLTSGG